MLPLNDEAVPSTMHSVQAEIQQAALELHFCVSLAERIGSEGTLTTTSAE